MTADEARQKLFSMMREDECHAKTLVNHYADQFESLRQKASMMRRDEFLQEIDGRKEDERPISMLDRDAIATASAMIRLCGALEPDARILGDVRAGDALEALKNLLESAEEQSHRVMMVQNKKLYVDAMEFGRLALLLSNENEKLRAFASDVMKAWPDGDVDGGCLQDIAEKHGILAPETRFEPCMEGCECANYHNSDEWHRGVICLRRSALLTGVAQ